ncbi:MAG: GntR family transcriptional regulator [Burkholderiaceae bacterium]
MFITNTDRVRAELENQIVAGLLPPGAILDEAQLVRMFDVSRTPVREALLQLSAKGFVRIVPRAGIYVVQLSAGELAEMFEALAYAEGLCARLACRRITAAQLKKLAALQKSGRKVLKGHDLDAFLRYNLEFHDHIHNCSGNRYLRSQILHMRKRSNPYRRRQDEVSVDWVAEAWQEHQALVEALSERDEDAATAAAADHINARTRAIQEVAEVSPEHLFFDTNARQTMPGMMAAHRIDLYLQRWQ